MAKNTNHAVRINNKLFLQLTIAYYFQMVIVATKIEIVV